MSYQGPRRGPRPLQQNSNYNQQNWQRNTNWASDPPINYPNFHTNDEEEYEVGQNWNYQGNYPQQGLGWAGNYQEQRPPFYNQYRGERFGNYNQHPYQRPIKQEYEERNPNRQLEKMKKSFSKKKQINKFKPVVITERKDSGTEANNEQNSSEVSNASTSEPKFQNLQEHVKSNRPYQEPKEKRQDIWCAKASSNNNENTAQPNTPPEVRDDVAGASSNEQTASSIIDLTSNDDVQHQPGTSPPKNISDKENRSDNTVSDEHLKVAKIALQNINGSGNWTIKKPTEANPESSIPSCSSNNDVTENTSIVENNNSNRTKLTSSTLIQSSSTLGNKVVIRASFLDEQDRLDHESLDGASQMTSSSSNLEPTIYCQGEQNTPTALRCDRFSLSKAQQKDPISAEKNAAPLVFDDNEMVIHNLISDSDSDDSIVEDYGRYCRKKKSPPCKIKSLEENLTNVKKPKILAEDKNQPGQLLEKRNSIELVGIVHPVKKMCEVIEISDDEDGIEQMETDSPALRQTLPVLENRMKERASTIPPKEIERKNSVEGISTKKKINATILPSVASIEHSVPSTSKTTISNPEKVMKRKNSNSVSTQPILEDCRSVIESNTNISKHQKLSSSETTNSVNSTSLPVASTSQETTRQMTSKQVFAPVKSILKPKPSTNSGISKSLPEAAPLQERTRQMISEPVKLIEKSKQSTSSAIIKSVHNIATTRLPTSSLPSQQTSFAVNSNNKPKQSVCCAEKNSSSTVTKAIPRSSLKKDKTKESIGLARKCESTVTKQPTLPTSSLLSKQESSAIKSQSTCSTKKNTPLTLTKTLPTSSLPSQQEITSTNLQKKIQHSTSSTKNNKSIAIKKDLPISHQEGKLKSIIQNSKTPVVLLKRLSPDEISKFSVSKKLVDKSAQYQKDILSQMKYFISTIYHAKRQNYEVSLASEVNDPEDLFNKLLHVHNQNGSLLVEFKYLKKQKQNDKITYKTLSSAEFDIKKLYQNFIEFHKNSVKVCQYSIYTNLDVSIEAFKNNGIIAELHEDRCYKFAVNKDHELHRKFLESLTLPKIAKLVIQCLELGKQKNFNTGLIKKYHLALVKENIFMVQKKKSSCGKSGLVAKFHPDFIHQKGLSNAAKELYRLLSKNKPTKEMEFSIAGGFGKDIHFDPDPKLDDIKKLAAALVYQEEKKFLNVRRDLEKIMGHILQKEKRDTFGFTKQFLLRGEDLPGDLKKLRWEVKVMLQHQGKRLYEFCQSKITIKDFCIDRPVEILPDEDCETLFDEFFRCFEFMKLDRFKHVLDHDIVRIDDEGCIEALQAEMLENIKKQDLGNASLKSIKYLASKCKFTHNLCLDSQTNVDVEFDGNVLETLGAQIPRNSAVLITTSNLELLNLKIKQLCTKVFKYEKGKESLFITNRTLVEMKHDVLNALAHKSTNLLIVKWSEPMKIENQVYDVFDQLLARLEEYIPETDNSKKSVIVIGNLKTCSFLTKIIRNRIIDDEQSSDLSKDSMAKLLHSENVYLQHRKLSLKPNLILDEHVPLLLENPEILRQLLSGRLTIGKDLTRPPCHKESFFKPQIKQYILINPQIFHEAIEDVFIIRNIDRKDLQQYLPARQKVLSPNDVPASMRINARFILLGFNIPTSFFDDYAEKNQEHSVHLLRYESGSFVWEKTKGNIKDLLVHRLDNTNDLSKSQKIEDVVRDGPMTVIICGESGSGKSVCLYTLAKETKHLYRDGPVDAYWSLQVNLDKIRLSKFTEKGLDIHMAGQQDYVAKFLCGYLELDEVQSKLLTMILNNELKIKLVIFFDNYEELPASDRKFVIELLQELQVSYCEKIYITSTNSTRAQLENALGVFAFTLEFSEVEKMDFLQGFWAKNVGDVDLTNEAGSLIDNYTKTSSEDDLTSTPLQLKMLATMCQPDEEEDFLAVESHVNLYRLFVEHTGVEDEESASIYSLHKLLDDQQLKSLNIQNTRKGFVYPDDLRHSSFFEYFSAKYLATKNHSPAIAKCINDLLESVSSVFLKTYLAELNANDDMVKVVSDYANNGHFNVVKRMLVHCDTKLQLTPVIESEHPEAQKVLRFLLDHYNKIKGEIMLHGEFKSSKYADSEIVRYVNRKEKPKKETPLKVAARMNKVPMACELLLKGASIRSIDEEFVAKVAKYVAEEMCKSESEWLHPIAEKLFKLQPTAVSHLNKTKELPRLLTYFFTHGRVELVNLLLKNDRDRYNILEAKVYEKSPLDLVNASRVLSDDERLEIAKYIVSNVGEDLERKNKYYLGDVLKTAAECNHERTFEYFVGKYPDKHMGFLQSAMKSNRLDLIRFLMRKTDRMMYPEENTALHKAVELGVSPTTINFLVNRGGIDNRNKAGETPLCIAFKEGHDLELIEYLIKKDAHLFAKDELGLYPWCYAILDESKYSAEEQMNIMKYLQEKETLKAPETEQKISFESDQKIKKIAMKLKFFQKSKSFFLENLKLHMALESNDECKIRFLISQGANVNQKDADGRTPLHFAIEFNRYKLVKMLLDRGATFDAKNNKNITPLMLLNKSDDNSKECKEIRELLELAMELFNGDEKYSAKVPRHLLNCRDFRGQTLLHVAAKSGNKMMIKEMIKHSKDYCIANKDFPALDVNAKDLKGNTPLNVAKNNVDVAKELLVNGAIFEPANTSLLQSAEKLIQGIKDNDVEKVKELIKTDCLVNARDHSGKSCLHWAAWSHDSREIVELLLTVRVLDVDALDENSRTPLHYAAENDNISTVFLLLKAGASYDMKDKQGKRPFDLDKKNDSLALLWKIHQMFADIKSDEPRILDNENADALIDYLAEIWKTWHVPKDIVVNVVDSKKNTLLHIATRYDFISVVENLLRQGAIYNPKNKAKKTPESMAISTRWLFKSIAKAQQKLSVSSWINMDPDIIVNVRFDRGYTLLHDCVLRGKKEEVRWLIENGVDVRATNNRGIGPRCDKKKYLEIFEMLEEEMLI